MRQRSSGCPAKSSMRSPYQCWRGARTGLGKCILFACRVMNDTADAMVCSCICRPLVAKNRPTASAIACSFPAAGKSSIQKPSNPREIAQANSAGPAADSLSQGRPKRHIIPDMCLLIHLLIEKLLVTHLPKIAGWPGSGRKPRECKCRLERRTSC